MIDSLRTDSASRRSDLRAPSTRSSTPSTARAIATLALAAAVLAPSQSMADRPRASLPTVRVSAEAAEVSNGNPSYIRATILRSYSPLQQCATQLPRTQNPTAVRVDVRLSIASDAAQPVSATLNTTRNSDAVFDASAFNTCAQNALRQLTWQRPPRGTTEASWSYTLQPQTTPAAR